MFAVFHHFTGEPVLEYSKNPVNAYKNNWLKLIYILTISFITIYGCLFSYTYITDLLNFEKTKLRSYREKELLRISHELDDDVRIGEVTLNNIRDYFNQYRLSPHTFTLKQLQIFMSHAMSMNQSQFNCYFALEPKISHELINKDAYIMTVKKNIRQMGTAKYGRGENRIVEFWFDPMYQKSKSEVWYHAAKRSRGFEISPVYFDSSYMKEWMFTIGIGIYENNKFEGMLGLDVLADTYFQRVETSHLNNTGGLFVVSNRSHKILTKITSISENIPIQVSVRNKTVLPERLKVLLDGGRREIEYSGRDGGTYIMNSRPLSNLPWTLISYQNKSRAYASSYRKAVLIACFSFLLIASSISIITFLLMKLGTMLGELVAAREKAEQRAIEIKNMQEKLIASERLAILGEFAGSVAHEIRNPLGVISGSAYYLKKRLKDDETSVAKAVLISKQVDRTVDIIDSILKLTHMEAPDLKEQNLINIIDTGIAASKLPETVKVSWKPVKEHILINADRQQLLIAVKNIVKNAAQAMNNNGALTISLEEIEVNGEPWFVIHFVDTGPGIDEENLEKIFNPLFTTKTYGIGFGLSIVKMIIERHGGIITASAPSERGADFIIRLPAKIL